MPQLKASMRWVRGSNPVVVRSSSPTIALEPTAYSVRCAPAFGGGSPPAFGSQAALPCAGRPSQQHPGQETPKTNTPRQENPRQQDQDSKTTTKGQEGTPVQPRRRQHDPASGPSHRPWGGWHGEGEGGGRDRAEPRPAADTGERGASVAGDALYGSPMRLRPGVRPLKKTDDKIYRASQGEPDRLCHRIPCACDTAHVSEAH